MKRRELLKTGLIAAGASALALSGCNNDDKEIKENISSDEELKIIPKQTGVYEFSAPLPFNFKTIDDIAKLNSTIKKSKVVSFFNNAPNQDFDNWIVIPRAKNDRIKTYEEFGKYVKHAQKNGFQFVYLMNSPKPFSEKDLATFENELKYLLDYLKKIECKDIKIGSSQVAQLITDLAPDEFNFHASTALEYHSISNYNYLFHKYRNFNLIDVSNDVNQNFKFLSALRKQFPKIKLELMVNEPCIKWCPARISCIAERNFSNFNCNRDSGMSPLYNFIKTGSIYPWDLVYYSAIGINNFKFLATDVTNSRAYFHDITDLKTYLTCIESDLSKIPALDFFKKTYALIKHADYIEYSQANNLKLSELKTYLPDINYFIKNGHNCIYRCRLECNYCYECVKKIEQHILLEQNIVKMS